MNNLFISFVIIIIIIISIFLFIKIIKCNRNLINNFENFEDYYEHFDTLIPTTNEITLPSPTVSPLLAILEETNKLDSIKQENKDLQFKKDLLQVKLQELDNKFKEISDATEKKNLEKLKLQDELLVINQQKELNLNMMDTIRKSMNANTEKEIKLKELEDKLNNEKKEIDDKTKYFEDVVLKPAPVLPPVTLKEEQIKPLMLILDSIVKIFTEINKKSDTIINLSSDKKLIKNVCTAYDSIPEPTKNSFMIDFTKIEPNNQELKNLPYLWCECNDTNKQSPECKKYLECHKNYEFNSKKAVLEGDDLTLYFKCLNDFKDFPPYITNNNENNKDNENK
jgi:hypothetical protein